MDAARPRALETPPGCTLHFLGLDALITNKRATGRLKDLADIEALGETP